MDRSHSALFAHVREVSGVDSGQEPPRELVPEPFLHVDAERVYNPLTGTALSPASDDFQNVTELSSGRAKAGGLPSATREKLLADGWIVADFGEELAKRFRLKYASIEATTTCNQACYFCPVSIAPREGYAMPMDLYERIVRQLAGYSATIEGVSMVQYNEPTADILFLERLSLLKRYGLAPAVLSNGTGLTPQRVDQIVALGGLRLLSINLSTLNHERYVEDRGHDHLDTVLRNVDYLAARRVADQMEIMVLGRGDENHRKDFEAIEERFGNSEFDVKYTEVMNRAGAVNSGDKPVEPIRRLQGCNQTGSRPLEWVHVMPDAKCVLCCQDYHGKYVIGDLNEQSLEDVLTGPAVARLRRQAYGIEDAPDDFICRHCVYARGD